MKTIDSLRNVLLGYFYSYTTEIELQNGVEIALKERRKHFIRLN